MLVVSRRRGVSGRDLKKIGCPFLAVVDLSGMIVSFRLAFQSERSGMIKGYCSLLQSEIMISEDNEATGGSCGLRVVYPTFLAARYMV